MAEPQVERSRPNSTKTIVVRVGTLENKQDFTVPKSFATQSSLAIQTTLNKREEAQEEGDDPVPLPRERPAEFEVYVYWLYTSKLVTTDTKGMNTYGTTLIRLYNLA